MVWLQVHGVWMVLLLFIVLCFCSPLDRREGVRMEFWTGTEYVTARLSVFTRLSDHDCLGDRSERTPRTK